MVTKLFPNGVTKALTLSYDDGVSQDKQLVQIFNEYNLKATFNLNSGLQKESSYWYGKNNKFIKRINADEIKSVYAGHEVAVHGLTHPHFEQLSTYNIFYELAEDKKNLESIFKYPVRGMAYPYGTYNRTVKEIMKTIGLKYSRTVNETQGFGIPEDFLEWHPTCYHKNPLLMDLANKYVALKSEGLSVFYLWGHSYEFDEDNNWELIKEFCSLVSNRNDIWYATNIEILEYIEALDKLIFTTDESIVYNTPGIFIPLKNHFEQEEGARRMGFEFNDIFRLKELIEERLGFNKDNRKIVNNGAQKAAEIILEFL
jgi:hypothetical protein